jgi:hypothetical protein
MHKNRRHESIALLRAEQIPLHVILARNISVQKPGISVSLKIISNAVQLISHKTEEKSSSAI